MSEQPRGTYIDDCVFEEWTFLTLNEKKRPTPIKFLNPLKIFMTPK